MSKMIIACACLTVLFAVEESKEFVYVLDNVPHDWLFLQCKAVVRPVFLSRMLICQKSSMMV
jgi:hypothetical protein